MMKKHAVTRIGVAAALLGGLVQVAQAHEITDALGSGAKATDTWLLTCPSDTARVFGTVQKTSNPGNATQIALQVIGPGPNRLAKSTIAPSNGGTSSALGVPAGGGKYLILVDKTASGIEAYTGTIHCLNAQGGEVTSGEPVLISSR